jgi:hypothetical protein
VQVQGENGASFVCTLLYKNVQVSIWYDFIFHLRVAVLTLAVVTIARLYIHASTQILERGGKNTKPEKLTQALSRSCFEAW